VPRVHREACAITVALPADKRQPPLWRLPAACVARLQL